MSRFLKPSVNWLFVFLPVTLGLEHLHAAPQLIFFSAALAIIPAAALIVQATEQLAARTGDAVGGLLNATFGNAPELIIALTAVRAGYLDMVRATLIGAILANLLFAQGVAYLIGGLKYHTQNFNPSASRTYSTMMLLATTSLIIPSAFSRLFETGAVVRQEQLLNIGIAFLLLFAYGLYLLFSLKTHPEAFKSVETGPDTHHAAAPWGVGRAVASLVAASLLAAWLSEILVGAAEATGKALGMSQTFIGLVFLAIIGGAAESGSAVAMARKNKMDLTIGITLGSSIQIALFVAPVLVLASCFIAPQPLHLSFGRTEIGALFLGLLLGTIVSGDGQANWYKGVQLITVYAITALMFYLMPVLSS